LQEFVSKKWLNRDMGSKSEDVDPNKAAFLAALEKKKSQGAKGSSAGTTAENSKAKSSGPAAARRIERRRSGAS
jgi:hypothetical protein